MNTDIRQEQIPENGQTQNLRKIKIIAAAEKLFCNASYEAVSIRDIAAEADVNSALVRYYFGAKEDLYRALFDRRYHAITVERTARMQALSLEPGSLASLRALVRAWVEPLLTLLDDPGSRNFINLLAREASDPGRDEHGIFRDYLDPSARLCIKAMRTLFPHARRGDVVQGYLWLVSTLMSTVSSASRASRLSQSGTTAAVKPSARTEKVEVFVAHGIWALMNAACDPAPLDRSARPRKG